MDSKKKIGIIVQRYGIQVNGGAEVHAGMIAEKLNGKYDVTVLTSRALDYHTWKPELPPGETYENGIRIIRFDHPPKGSRSRIHYLNRLSRGRLLFQKIYRILGKPEWYNKIFPNADYLTTDQTEWLTLQGPAMADLGAYIIKNDRYYSAYIFFTYLYYPTAVCMLPVAHKSILIPTMHDEPPAYFPVFKKVMAAPKRIFFNTEAEKTFSENLFPIDSVSKRVVAVGIECVDTKPNYLIPRECGIDGLFIIYIGRIDAAKGCEQLLRDFMAYADKGGNLKLVLVGKNMINPIIHRNIIYTGFVSDEKKTQLMLNARAVVVPSKYESLSLVLLESFAAGVPVIANGFSEVLADHVSNSKGGWLYKDATDFETALNEIQNPKEAKRRGLNGKEYVAAKYNWNKVLNEFDDAIEFISGDSLID